MAVKAERARVEVRDAGTVLETVRHEHDAFGRIILNRSHGGGQAMFGSAIEHNTAVTIEIERAHLDRRLNRDWVHGDETLLRLRMSEHQWAQFVASQGNGSGTQVTLEYAPARGTPLARMPELLLDPVRQTFEDEVRKAAREASEGVRKAEAAVREMTKPGAKPSKKDLEALLGLLRAAGEHFEGNMGFAQKSFVEAMESTVSAAKVEVESFVTQVALSTGLEALRNGAAPRLIEARDLPGDGGCPVIEGNPAPRSEEG